MSSKKIIRLKTPQRPNETKRSPDHGSPCISEYLSDETIMKIKNNQTDNVNSALIAELNKVYGEIQFLKQRLYQEENLRKQMINQNRLLKSRLEMLQRECNLEKEKFQLERDNHERLRRFYEQRQKEWIRILLQHRNLLEQYGKRNESNQAKINKKLKYNTPCESMSNSKTTQQTLTNRNNFFRIHDDFGQNFEAIKENLDYNRIRQISSTKNRTGDYYQKIIQTLQQQHTKYLNNLSQSQLNEITEYSEGKLFSHDEEIQEIFDKVLRQTFLKFRQQGLRVLEIQQSEDMIKLKKAKTSTKNRLQKTLKKLNFQFQQETQMEKFCSFVEKCVLDQYKQFQGCYVFDFLMEKLYECQKMAVASNSFIDKLLRLQESKVSTISPQKNQLQKKPEKELSNSSLIIDLQKRLSLLLDSAIKQKQESKDELKKQQQENGIEEALYTVSSLQNLSDLIKEYREGYQINGFTE